MFLSLRGPEKEFEKESGFQKRRGLVLSHFAARLSEPTRPSLCVYGLWGQRPFLNGSIPKKGRCPLFSRKTRTGAPVPPRHFSESHSLPQVGSGKIIGPMSLGKHLLPPQNYRCNRYFRTNLLLIPNAGRRRPLGKKKSFTTSHPIHTK